MLDAPGNGNDRVQRKFFRERQSLDFLRSYRGEGASVDYQNVDGLTGAILAERLATYKELRDELTLEEALNLWEVIAVTRYNEHLAIKHNERKGG